MRELLQSIEYYFYPLVLVSLFITAVTVIPFGRCVARMEREMQRDGHPRPSAWDGIGLRLFWYASAITFPIGWYNSENDPFINVKLVRQYANTTDRTLAFAVEVSSAFTILVIALAVVLDL